MKQIIFLVATVLNFTARAQTANQYALSSSGSGQGQANGYHFEYSVGELFSNTGLSPQVINTPGIIQPILVGAPFPVKLIAFDARKEGVNSIILNWSTAEEVNSDHFEIQRSVNSKQWAALGSVAAMGETKNTVSEYAFVDSGPAAGTNLYRLKMVDLDGTYAFSKIIVVTSERSTNMIAFPNPASERLFIQVPAGFQKASARLLTPSGKIVHWADYDSKNGIDVRALMPGSYLLIVKDGSNVDQSLRVVIAK